MTKKSPLMALAGLVVVAIGLAGCASSGQPSSSSSAKVAVKVGITPIVNAAPLYLGIKEGFFADEGLKVEPSIIQTAATAIPSLLTDKLEFAQVSPIPTITAASKGLPVQMVLGNDRYSTDPAAPTGAALLASAHGGITKPADLAGKTIAVVGLKSAPELGVRLALEKAGVDTGGVKFVEIAYPDMVSALQSDRVDAALVVDPFLAQGEQAGLVEIMQPLGAAFAGRPSVGWIASSSYLQSHKDVASRFSRAMRKAVAYAAHHASAARAILSTYTSLSAAARAKTLLPRFDSTLTTADVQFFADAMTKQGFITKHYDASRLIWKP